MNKKNSLKSERMMKGKNKGNEKFKILVAKDRALGEPSRQIWY